MSMVRHSTNPAGGRRRLAACALALAAACLPASIPAARAPGSCFHLPVRTLGGENNAVSQRAARKFQRISGSRRFPSFALKDPEGDFNALIRHIASKVPPARSSRTPAAARQG